MYPEPVPAPQYMGRGVDPDFFGAPEAAGPDLRDYFRVIRRHARLIASMFLAAMLVTVLVVLVVTPHFTAMSTILVEPNAPHVLDIHELASETGDAADYYKTQEEILKSRGLAAQVIRDLGLDRNPDFTGSSSHRGFFGEMIHSVKASLGDMFKSQAPAVRPLDQYGVGPEMVDKYLSDLTVKPDVGTRLFVISFTSANAALASQVANTHVRTYIHRGMEIHAQASEDARQFLEKKLVELKERVEKSEAALNSYRRASGIIAFNLDDRGTILNERLKEMNEALTKAETERIDLESQHDLINKRNYSSLPAVVGSPLIQQLKTQDDVIAGQYASMSQQFKGDYPPLKELKAKVDETNARLNTEIDHTVQGVESQYQASVGRETGLKQSVEDLKTKALALNDASLQDAVLAREVDANRQLYKSVLERMKEIGVAGEVPTSNVSIIDTATTPISPSSPKKLIDMAIAGAMALFLGVGIAFLLDHLDDGLHNPEEAELYLQLPSLGSVPDFLTLGAEDEAAETALPVTGAAPTLIASSASDEREIMMAKSRFSIAGESYRAIRTAILLSRAAEAPKTLLVASGAKAEGKTVTAVNIAMAFAQMGGRVLLIDADLRRARCHEVLGVHNLVGLTEVLVGQKQASEVIRPIGNGGLSFMSAGSVPPNPTELLASRRMQEVLEELAASYDSVLIDSPPVMPVSDSVVLSRLVDGVVIVVGPRTPKQLVRHACSRLGQVGARILGVVLNQVNMKSPDYYHYHRYYAYEDYSKPAGTVSQV
ncbi:MAG TPA: polysaccharide biosynthesis tyrosine autokinase [Candidatus Binataceae bacterium]|nr:polysaccharide biosynthesis tyrosine autokinase [Candidatus Binataceae bacterium]